MDLLTTLLITFVAAVLLIAVLRHRQKAGYALNPFLNRDTGQEAQLVAAENAQSADRTHLSIRQKRASSPSPRLLFGRDQHPVSRKQLSDNALKVLYRLKDGGYDAYLVGGCIRDLLLGKQPKDYDVATNATPEQVNKLFRNSRLIGRRFKLVHVRFGREIIEVATFRTSHDAEHNTEQEHGRQAESGMILRDNVYGTIEEDALRRDFTVNALYYSINDFGIHDYANGMADIEHRTLRMIGDPEARYREDPVRMLRAVRFAAKLDFQMDAATEDPIRKLAPMLLAIPAARLFDEVLKMLLSGQGVATYKLLREYDLFAPLFPATAVLLEKEAAQEGERPIEALLLQSLRNTDLRIEQGKSITPAFIYAAMLWYPLQARLKDYQQDGMPFLQALHQAGQDVVREQCRATSIPKRFSIPMREIWDMQFRLIRRHGRRAEQLVQHPRFRAAYDFLLMREASGEQLDNLGQWWTDYQQADVEGRQTMVKALGAGGGGRRKRPRKRSRKPGAQKTSTSPPNH